jgi:SAM-dependent methyltransferase
MPSAPDPSAAAAAAADPTRQTRDEQQALWNGRAGQVWVESQQLLDEMFRSIEALLVEAVAARDGEAVLDIGCGTGATTLAVARLPAARARCLGVDLSEPMISVARGRAERDGSPARFEVGDAEHHAFEPASFDTFISRFGVMFFADPVAAFTNLRRAARPGAALRCIAWRSAADNPFMTTAERAVAPLLELPPRKTDGPGQFAFADEAKVRRVLQASGWAQIELQPIDVPCTLAERELVHYFTHLGPIGQALQTIDEPLRAEVIATARAAFEPFVHGAEVRFTAACWMMRAAA